MSMGENICPVCGYDGVDEPAFDERGVGSYDICPCCACQFGLSGFPYEGGEGPVAEWRGRRDDGGQWRQDGGTR